jgi:hypothetical protein
LFNVISGKKGEEKKGVVKEKVKTEKDKGRLKLKG